MRLARSAQSASENAARLFFPCDPPPFPLFIRRLSLLAPRITSPPKQSGIKFRRSLCRHSAEAIPREKHAIATHPLLLPPPWAAFPLPPPRKCNQMPPLTEAEGRQSAWVRLFGSRSLCVIGCSPLAFLVPEPKPNSTQDRQAAQSDLWPRAWPAG